MKNLLILERSVSEAEFQKTANGDYILEGIFSEIGTKNKNNRIYDEAEFVPHVEELAKKVKDRKILGELDHPKQFEVSLKNVSHVIEEISYDKSSKQVRGRIKLLDTDAGKQAKALVDAGVPIHISSRAAGVVESNNHVKVKRLFTYDLVADPGFENAKLNRVNESFGLQNDDTIQIFEMDNTNNGLTQVNAPEVAINETKGESFISMDQFDKYSKYITEQFNKIQESIKSINESDTSSNNTKEQSQIVEWVETIAKEVNSMNSKIHKVEENTDNLIAHNDYIVEGLESVKDYTELVALKTDQGIEYSKSLAENLDNSIEYSKMVAESVDNSIEYSKHITEEVNSRFEYQTTINESVDTLISHNDYIVENMEHVANFTEYIKENLETLGSYTEHSINDINENFEELNGAKLINESNGRISKQSEPKENLIIESNDNFKNDISTKINTLLESAKKQKAVTEDKDLHFLHFVTESKRSEFEKLNESSQGDLILAFKNNKYFGTRDVERIWESATTPEPKVLNWLENIPAKYKESYDSLSESKQEEIKLQASVSVLESQYQIDHFWSTRDLRSEIIQPINESAIASSESINEVKVTSSYMDAVTEGLAKRFKTNKI